MKKKIILIGLLLLSAAAAIGLGFYEYNRRNSSLADVPPSILVASDQLFAAFEQNETTANKQYLGKIVQVDGKLRGIELDHTGRLTLVIGSGTSSIRCSMDSACHAAPAGWTNGRTVAVKGLLTGFNRDDTGLIGSDIELSRCVPEGAGSRNNSPSN